MAQLSVRSAVTSPSRITTGLGQRLSRAHAWLRRAMEVSRQRRALYQLDDVALSDLGLSRADAWQEADKPFWKQSVEESDRRSC